MAPRSSFPASSLCRYLLGTTFFGTSRRFQVQHPKTVAEWHPYRSLRLQKLCQNWPLDSLDQQKCWVQEKTGCRYWTLSSPLCAKHLIEFMFMISTACSLPRLIVHTEWKTGPAWRPGTVVWKQDDAAWLRPKTFMNSKTWALQMRSLMVPKIPRHTNCTCCTCFTFCTCW